MSCNSSIAAAKFAFRSSYRRSQFPYRTFPPLFPISTFLSPATPARLRPLAPRQSMTSSAARSAPPPTRSDPPPYPPSRFHAVLSASAPVYFPRAERSALRSSRTKKSPGAIILHRGLTHLRIARRAQYASFDQSPIRSSPSSSIHGTVRMSSVVSSSTSASVRSAASPFTNSTSSTRLTESWYDAKSFAPPV